MFLLPGATVSHDHRRDHVEAERDEARRTGRSGFLVEDVILHRRPAAPAVLDRPVTGEPALLRENVLPAGVVALLEAAMLEHLAGDIGRKVGCHEVANLVAERGFLGGIGEIHGHKRWRIDRGKRDARGHQC